MIFSLVVAGKCRADLGSVVGASGAGGRDPPFAVNYL